MTTDKIINYRDLIAKSTRGFVGRQWLRDEVDQFLNSDGPRFFLLLGEPGSGKTAFMAQLANARGYPHHFIGKGSLTGVGTSLDWRNPIRFAESLGYQLVRDYGSWIMRWDEWGIHVDQRVQNLEGLLVGAKVGELKVAPRPSEHPILTVDQEVEQFGRVAQIIGVYVEKYVVDVEQIMRQLLITPLKSIAEQWPELQIVIVVDGLDEAEGYSNPQQNILKMLPNAELPPSVRFLVSSRPGTHIKQDFLTQSKIVWLSENEYQPQDEGIIGDAVTFASQLAAEDPVKHMLSQKGLAATDFSSSVALASRGNFLYLYHYAQGLRDGDQTLLNLEGLPKGLYGIYADFLSKIKETHEDIPWTLSYKPVLGSLAVAYAPLTRDQIAGFAGAEPEVVGTILTQVKQFLDANEQNNGKQYALYHPSFGEFLISDQNEDFIDGSRAHLRVINSYRNGAATWQDIEWDGCDDYGLRYVIDHLIDVFRHPQELEQVNRQSEASNVLRQLLSGDRFLLAKARRLGLWAATEDLSNLKGLASEGRFDLGVAISAEGFVIRVLLDCYKRPQAWTRTTDRQTIETVEALIREAEDAGEGELLPMLSDIKDGMRVYRRAEIAHASPQAVFDVFAEPEGIATWINPWALRLRPKPAQAQTLQVDDEVCGWRVVAAETGRMVQLQNIEDQGMWQRIAATRETDTTSRLLLVLVLPLNHWRALSDLGAAVFPVLLKVASLPPVASIPLNLGSKFLAIFAERDRDVLRHIARLAEARNQVDPQRQKALCRDYTGRSLLVGAGIVLSLVMMILSIIALFVPSVFTNAVAGSLVVLALAVCLGASALNLVWLRQASRIEHVFGVTLPGAKILQTLWRIARRLTLLIVLVMFLAVIVIILFG